MAYVFTVEDGTGLPAANSYVSVTEADDYFTIDPFFTTWDLLTLASQEYYLSWASRILDQKTEWRGTLFSDTSGLRWPRSGAYTRDGIAISAYVVPTVVKQATCEIAKFLQTNDPTTGQDSESIKRIIADVVEIEFQDQTHQTTTPSIINAILKGVGYFSSGVRGFGRILRA